MHNIENIKCVITLKIVVCSYTHRKGKTRDLNLFRHAAFDIVFLCFMFYFSLLGMFTKLQKATLASLCLSVHLSIHMEKLGSHWMYFKKI
jgi:Ca2+/Na+ antiporter